MFAADNYTFIIAYSLNWENTSWFLNDENHNIYGIPKWKNILLNYSIVIQCFVGIFCCCFNSNYENATKIKFQRRFVIDC